MSAETRIFLHVYSIYEIYRTVGVTSVVKQKEICVALAVPPRHLHPYI